MERLERQTLNDQPVPSKDSAVNPYAAPVAEAILADEQPPLVPPAPGSVIIKWLIVCGIAAGPSFYFGGGIGGWCGPEVLGMIVGILIFVAGYSLIEFTPQIQSAMAQRAKRRASRIAYISRMAISILFPIGVFVDLYCGIFSLGLTSAITGGDWTGLRQPNAETHSTTARFLTFLLTTMIQGVLLNILLFAYMLIVYGFLRLVGVKNLPPATNNTAQMEETQTVPNQRSDSVS